MEVFYDEHVNKVYKFFYIKCLDRMTAEDLTSRTFINFIEKSKTTEIEDRKKYLYGIMRNTWIQFLREKYARAIVDVESIEDFESYSNKQLIDFENAKEPVNRLKPFVEKLPRKQKEVLELRIMQDKTTAEVALELGRDRNYVKTTYQRALRRLREMIKSPYMEVKNG